MHCIFGCPLSSSLRILSTKRGPLVDSKILRIRVTLQMSVPRFSAKGNFLRILGPDIDVRVPSLLLELHVLSRKETIRQTVLHQVRSWAVCDYVSTRQRFRCRLRWQ